MIQLQKTVALYQQIANYYEKEIVEGRLGPGDRIPATTELAKKFEVNTATVQQSLKLLMNRGLVGRAPGRGTFVRKGINSKTIGIIFGKEIYTDPNKVFYSAFLESLTTLLEDKGWNCKLFTSSEFAGYDKAFYDLKSEVDSGEIKAVIEFCSNSLISSWVSDECPVPYPKGPRHTDFKHFTYTGLDYLYKNGAQKVNVIAQDSDYGLKSYKKAISAFCNNRNIDSKNIILTPAASRIDKGYQAAKKIFKNGINCDSLLVSNDSTFKGVLYAILELGIKIPEQIKVLTHANKGVDLFCHLPLTRLEVDPDNFATQTWEELIRKIEGGKYNFKPIKTTLIKGKTCGE